MAAVGDEPLFRDGGFGSTDPVKPTACACGVDAI
jgi:hypothetical protein